MVHVASTNVPFTSESKDAVANVPEIEKEIELALRESARELKSYLNRRRSMQQRRQKQDKLGTILPEMAQKLSAVTDREDLDIDTTLARIMNDVLVSRERERGTVTLRVENNDDTNVDLDVTEMVETDTEPELLEDAAATAVEMDGEWFLNWSPTVGSGETTTLRYTVDDGADCVAHVDGIPEEKLTNDAGP
jgi:DNA topoisomerase-6 subunit B